MRLLLIIYIIMSVCAFLPPGLNAAERNDTLTVSEDTIKKKGLLDRISDYFGSSNKTPSNKGFDISFLGGPHYSSDTKLGLGLVASGLYRVDRADTILPPSNVALYSDVSTVGFYMVGVRGTNIMPADRMRLLYNLYLYSFDTDFWGIGYDMGCLDSNKSSYRKFQTSLSVQLLMNIGRHCFLGPSVDLCYVNATHIKAPRLWEGERLQLLTSGMGAIFTFDTRDNLTAPHKGYHVQLSQHFYPQTWGNKNLFAVSRIIAAGYWGMWKGATLAGRFHVRGAYGSHVPWTMLSSLADGVSMRGYYPGRYIDKFETDITLELRQHIWRRNGVVAWIGAGTIAPAPQDIRWKRVLPNAGIGYRWEFKRNSNVRVDFGIGRHSTAFAFNINEAF